MTVITEKDFRKAYRRAKIREGVQNVLKFVGDNIVVLSVVVPVVGGITNAIVKGGAKAIASAISGRNEALLKDRRCYDTSLGHYWELKRKLSNSEWTTIDRRRNNGEKLGEILNSMKVLK